MTITRGMLDPTKVAHWEERLQQYDDCVLVAEDAMNYVDYDIDVVLVLRAKSATNTIDHVVSLDKSRALLQKCFPDFNLSIKAGRIIFLPKN